MMQQGFDYAYDKPLYDRLREGHARPVREHLWAGLDFHSKVARFLERLSQSLNPLQLRRDLEATLERWWTLATPGPSWSR